MELINKIEELSKELANHNPLSVEQAEMLQKKMRLEFNYNSNHIEGNTLTYAETELLLIFDETRGNHILREYEEMRASDVALRMVEDYAKDPNFQISELFIKELNKVLLVRPYWKDAITMDNQKTRRKILIGDYKKHPNSVLLENGEIFSYASPMETPAKMGDLVNWLREVESKKSFHPVDVAAELHYRFVCIHPFDDGNGRISRLLMNYIFLKNNFPPVIIKSEDKKNYLSALRDADTGNFESFKSYIAQQLIWSLELSIKAANNEDLEEEGDWKKQLTLIKRRLSSTEAIKTVKSIETIDKLINITILEFSLNVMKDLSEFDDLFLNKGILISSPTTGAQNVITKESKILERRIQEQYFNQLNLSFQFYEFKKDPDNAFSISLTLEFEFSKHKFVVLFNGNKVFNMLYHQNFSEQEVRELINNFGKNLTLQIEDKIKS